VHVWCTGCQRQAAHGQSTGSENNWWQSGLKWCSVRTLSCENPLAGSAIRLYAALSERLILPCGKFSLGMSVPAAR
jgi:hypothetical protein